MGRSISAVRQRSTLTNSVAQWLAHSETLSEEALDDQYCPDLFVGG